MAYGRKMSLLVLITIGLIISFLVGIASCHLYMDKTIVYHELVLWKQGIIMLFVIWYCSELCGFIAGFPVFINAIKTTAICIVLSAPWITVLVLTKAISLATVLNTIPGVMLVIIVLFIFAVAQEIDKEIEKQKYRHIIVAMILYLATRLIIEPVVSPILRIPLAVVGGLLYMLWLLYNAKRKSENNSEESIQ